MNLRELQNSRTLVTRADVELIEALADEATIDILVDLLGAADGMTQREIVVARGLDSGGASRRMKRLEQLGLVERPRSHGPYTLTLPAETRDVLERVSHLAALGLTGRARAATARAKDFQKAGMRGDRLLPRGEGSSA